MIEEEYAELEAKRLAYLEQQKRYYQQTFGNPVGQEVVRDLIAFCHAKVTTNVLGEKHLIWLYEGRRQVWLRIEDYLTLSPEELREKYRPAK